MIIDYDINKLQQQADESQSKIDQKISLLKRDATFDSLIKELKTYTQCVNAIMHSTHEYSEEYKQHRKVAHIITHILRTVDTPSDQTN